MKLNNPYWFIAFVILSLIFGFVMAMMIKKNTQCIANPLVYGANHIKAIDPMTNITYYPMCSCKIANNDFYFDQDGLYNENPLLEGFK